MKRVNALSLIALLIITSLWTTPSRAASNGLAINDDGLELRYTTNVREKRPAWGGPMIYHYTLLTSQESAPRNIMLTGTADLHKWRKHWEEKQMILIPRAELNVLEFFDRKFFAPGVGLALHKRLPSLGPYELRSSFKLAPGFTVTGAGGTVWGATASLHRPFLDNLELYAGYRFIRADTNTRSSTDFEKGLYVGIGHFFE